MVESNVQTSGATGNRHSLVKNECRGPGVYSIVAKSGGDISSINEADCLSVQQCNWNPMLRDTKSCVTDMTNLGKASFCAADRGGGNVQEVSVFPTCRSAGPFRREAGDAVRSISDERCMVCCIAYVVAEVTSTAAPTLRPWRLQEPARTTSSR